MWQMTGTNLIRDYVLGTPSNTAVIAATGDFDGDGRGDVVLRNAATGSVGTWRLTDAGIAETGALASAASQWSILGTGDFDGDTLDDIALTGPVGWGTIPVALSNGDGSFTVTNVAVTDFPIFASQAGARPVSGH